MVYLNFQHPFFVLLVTCFISTYVMNPFFTSTVSSQLSFNIYPSFSVPCDSYFFVLIQISTAYHTPSVWWTSLNSSYSSGLLLMNFSLFVWKESSLTFISERPCHWVKNPELYLFFSHFRMSLQSSRMYSFWQEVCVLLTYVFCPIL